MQTLLTGVRPLFHHFILTALLALPLTLHAQGLELTINGSNTIGARLAPLLAEGMLKESGAREIEMQLNPDSREHLITAVSTDNEPIVIRINAHGSSTGFRGLIDQSGQIAAASRPIRSGEVQALSTAGEMRSQQAEQIIGLDGLAVIVHPDNPLNTLSMEQLAAVFSGQISRWEQLGGHAGAIHLYARDSNSGTWETFQDLVLNPVQLELHETAHRYQSNADLSASISLDVNGIGFVGLDSIGKARALALSAGQSRPMLPNQKLVATEDYPLARRLYLYLRPDEQNPLALAMINFTQSRAGQELVNQVGFVGQNIEAGREDVHDDMPDAYRTLAQEAQRLSVNFRFEEGLAQLDNKAMQDIKRLVAYLREHDKTESNVVLVGFSDPRRRNASLLSRLRAMVVRTQLIMNNVVIKDLIGVGDQLPVAANSDTEGRFKNRRVEVWVY